MVISELCERFRGSPATEKGYHETYEAQPGLKHKREPVFTCIPGSNAHWQSCTHKCVALLGWTYPPTLSAIFISTVTIKGCGCCWDTLAGANIIFVVEPAATVSTYL